MCRCSMVCAAFLALTLAVGLGGPGCGDKGTGIHQDGGGDGGGDGDASPLPDSAVGDDTGVEGDGGGVDAQVPVCGDGVIEGGEVCDGTQLGGASCISRGFSAGELRCTSNCYYFNTHYCEHAANRCGNGVREAPEQCDGLDVGFYTCSTFGGSGQLACGADCTMDTSGCVYDELCALNDYYWNGVCDPCELYGGVPDPDCELFCGADGHCADAETLQTGYVPSCLLSQGSPDPDCNPGLCGDGAAQGWEACDTSDLGGVGCVDLGFASGTLACDQGCNLDVTGCMRHPCGDGVAEGNEVCDGGDLKGANCLSVLAHRYVGGTLGCNATCDGWDVSLCVSPVCGDDQIDGREQCDNANLASVECDMVGYLGGTVACDPVTCQFDWTGCTVPVCGDGVVEGDYEQCDGPELDGHGCADWGFTGGTLGCDPTCVVFDFSGCTGTPAPP